MKRFVIESACMLAGCVALFVAYHLTERHFGGEGKWVFVAVGATAVAVFLALRARRGRRS